MKFNLMLVLFSFLLISCDNTQTTISHWQLTLEDNYVVNRSMLYEKAENSYYISHEDCDDIDFKDQVLVGTLPTDITIESCLIPLLKVTHWSYEPELYGYDIVYHNDPNPTYSTKFEQASTENKQFILTYKTTHISTSGTASPSVVMTYLDIFRFPLN
jgi:hypothetical protein